MALLDGVWVGLFLLLGVLGSPLAALVSTLCRSLLLLHRHSRLQQQQLRPGLQCCSSSSSSSSKSRLVWEGGPLLALVAFRACLQTSGAGLPLAPWLLASLLLLEAAAVEQRQASPQSSSGMLLRLLRRLLPRETLAVSALHRAEGEEWAALEARPTALLPAASAQK